MVTASSYKLHSDVSAVYMIMHDMWNLSRPRIEKDRICARFFFYHTILRITPGDETPVSSVFGSRKNRKAIFAVRLTL